MSFGNFDDDYEYLRSHSTEGLLRELLAALHGDGGHHTEDVVLSQSVIDAMKLHYGITKHTKQESQ